MQKKPERAVTRASGEAGEVKTALDRYERSRLRLRIQELEKEIMILEEDEVQAVEQLGDPETYNSTDATDLVRNLNEIIRVVHARLPEAYREWEECSLRLEEDRRQ